MFIKTGKSLFGNTGLIISMFILLILLYFSYNKCYNNNNNNTIFEQFICESGTEPNCKTLPRPDNVRILINPLLDIGSEHFISAFVTYPNEVVVSGIEISLDGYANGYLMGTEDGLILTTESA